jgi:hypothetical protein
MRLHPVISYSAVLLVLLVFRVNFHSAVGKYLGYEVNPSFRTVGRGSGSIFIADIYMFVNDVELTLIQGFNCKSSSTIAPFKSLNYHNASSIRPYD